MGTSGSAAGVSSSSEYQPIFGFVNEKSKLKDQAPSKAAKVSQDAIAGVGRALTEREIKAERKEILDKIRKANKADLAKISLKDVVKATLSILEHIGRTDRFSHGWWDNFWRSFVINGVTDAIANQMKGLVTEETLIQNYQKGVEALGGKLAEPYEVPEEFNSERLKKLNFLGFEATNRIQSSGVRAEVKKLVDVITVRQVIPFAMEKFDSEELAHHIRPLLWIVLGRLYDRVFQKDKKSGHETLAVAVLTQGLFQMSKLLNYFYFVRLNEPGLQGEDLDQALYEEKAFIQGIWEGGDAEKQIFDGVNIPIRDELLGDLVETGLVTEETQDLLHHALTDAMRDFFAYLSDPKNTYKWVLKLMGKKVPAEVSELPAEEQRRIMAAMILEKLEDVPEQIWATGEGPNIRRALKTYTGLKGAELDAFLVNLFRNLVDFFNVRANKQWFFTYYTSMIKILMKG